MLATKLALVGWLLLQTYNVPFSPRAAAASGTCAGSPDFTEVLVALNWLNADCTSPVTSNYTTEADTGDHPDAVTVTRPTPETGDTIQLQNSPDVGPLTSNDCVAYFEFDETRNGSAQAWRMDLPSSPGAQGSLYAEVRHDHGGTSTDPEGTFPALVGISDGTVNSRVVIWFTGEGTPDDDLSCQVRDGSGGTVAVGTANDTTSGCCGASGCNNVFQVYDDTPFAVECVWDSDETTDYVKLYINGCLVGTDNTAMATMAIDTDHDLYVGDMDTNAEGTYAVGRVAVGTNASGSIILTDEVSGESAGSANINDGDECWCADAGSGTDC